MEYYIPESDRAETEMNLASSLRPSNHPLSLWASGISGFIYKVLF